MSKRKKQNRLRTVLCESLEPRKLLSATLGATLNAAQLQPVILNDGQQVIPAEAQAETVVAQDGTDLNTAPATTSSDSSAGDSESNSEEESETEQATEETQSELPSDSSSDSNEGTSSSANDTSSASNPQNEESSNSSGATAGNGKTGGVGATSGIGAAGSSDQQVSTASRVSAGATVGSETDTPTGNSVTTVSAEGTLTLQKRSTQSGSDAANESVSPGTFEFSLENGNAGSGNKISGGGLLNSGFVNAIGEVESELPPLNDSGAETEFGVELPAFSSASPLPNANARLRASVELGDTRAVLDASVSIGSKPASSEAPFSDLESQVQSRELEDDQSGNNKSGKKDNPGADKGRKLGWYKNGKRDLPDEVEQLSTNVETPLQAPVQQAPVQQAPVQQAPVQQAPVQQAPVQQAPVQQAPVQQPIAAQQASPAQIPQAAAASTNSTQDAKQPNAQQPSVPTVLEDIPRSETELVSTPSGTDGNIGTQAEQAGVQELAQEVRPVATAASVPAPSQEQNSASNTNTAQENVPPTANQPASSGDVQAIVAAADSSYSPAETSATPASIVSSQPAQASREAYLVADSTEIGVEAAAGQRAALTSQAAGEATSDVPLVSSKAALGAESSPKRATQAQEVVVLGSRVPDAEIQASADSSESGSRSPSNGPQSPQVFAAIDSTEGSSYRITLQVEDVPKGIPAEAASRSADTSLVLNELEKAGFQNAEKSDSKIEDTQEPLVLRVTDESGETLALFVVEAMENNQGTSESDLTKNALRNGELRVTLDVKAGPTLLTSVENTAALDGTIEQPVSRISTLSEKARAASPLSLQEVSDAPESILRSTSGPISRSELAQRSASPKVMMHPQGEAEDNTKLVSKVKVARQDFKSAEGEFEPTAGGDQDTRSDDVNASSSQLQLKQDPNDNEDAMAPRAEIQSTSERSQKVKLVAFEFDGSVAGRKGVTAQARGAAIATTQQAEGNEGEETSSVDSTEQKTDPTFLAASQSATKSTYFMRELNGSISEGRSASDRSDQASESEPNEPASKTENVSSSLQVSKAASSEDAAVDEEDACEEPQVSETSAAAFGGFVFAGLSKNSMRITRSTKEKKKRT